MQTPLSAPVARAIEKIGADLSLARRRRQLSQASVAVRIGASTMTVRRMEQGAPRIALQYLARALHLFAELERLNTLLDSSHNSLGLSLMDEKLPQRVRARKAKPMTGAV